MSSRANILKRLRSAPRKPSARFTQSIPANRIQSDTLKYFIDQARKAGVEILSELPDSGLQNDTLRVDAHLGIAETGSVILLSTQTSSGSAFLCEHLIVHIQQHVVVPYLHTALSHFKSLPARATHLITGPSRTADVEQTIQIGAHGPKTVSYIIQADQ